MKYLMLMALLLIVTTLAAQTPWLRGADPENRAEEWQSLQVVADVSVSDGLTYKVNTLYIDPQRAIFERIYTDRKVTNGVEGKYAWSFDQKREIEGSSMTTSIVLGHQFYAQMLFFEKLHPTAAINENATFMDAASQSVITNDANGVYELFYDPAKLPLGMKIVLGETTITFVYSDWQSVDGVLLPHHIQIDDGERIFDYQFTEVSPNVGQLADHRCPYELLTEEQKLLRLHREVMDGHYFENMKSMYGFVSDSMHIVSAGEVYRMSGKRASESLDRSMKFRNHEMYDDLIRPVVSRSDDGSLAWVIVQVKAHGVRLDDKGNETEPLDFVSAWIELYEKVEGEWKMMGNVSNFIED
jgi:hypothetical protein